MANSAAKTCFAKLSANLFLSREIQEKETNSNEEAIDNISATMPYNSAKEASDFRALMRREQSDSQCMRGRARSLHFMSAVRRARPSAIRGELTNLAVEEKEATLLRSSVIQPKPAVFEASFQAASVLTKTQLGWFCMVGKEVFIVDGFFIWLLLHSAAAATANEMVSSTVIILLLKTRLFLDFHICQI